LVIEFNQNEIFDFIFRSCKNLFGVSGLNDDPLFNSFSQMSENNAVSNWGASSPPGGPGECLVQQNGAFYNASCEQKNHFACEEIPLPDGITTTT